jgi:hypothetical protein
MKDNKTNEKVLDFLKANSNASIENVTAGTKASDLFVRKSLKELQAAKLIEVNPDDGTYSVKSQGKTATPVADQKHDTKKEEAKTEKKKNEDDIGPKLNTGSRDNTRYRMGEARNLPKGRLVHLIVKTFVEKNPKMSLAKLQEIFHSEELQPRFHIILEQGAARKFSRNKVDRHFLAPDMIIKVGDKKVPVAICNQWTSIGINKLLKIVAAPPINLKVKAEVAE